MTTSSIPPEHGKYEADAQAAAEIAYDLIDYDVEAGASDGCPTCVVREILEAAWPHLKVLALQELVDDGDLGPAYQTVVDLAAGKAAESLTALKVLLEAAHTRTDDDETDDDDVDEYEVRTAESDEPIAVLRLVR